MLEEVIMKLSKILCLLILASLSAIALAFSAFASEGIVVESLTFEAYIDSEGVENKDLSLAKLKVSVPYGNDQITILLTSEEISEFTGETTSKIIYINQIDVPADGTFEFPIEKSKVLDAIGAQSAETAILHLKIGATSENTPASHEVVMEITAARILYGDVNNDKKVSSIDLIYISRYLANWSKYKDLANPLAADLYVDGKINSYDLISLARHLANWEKFSVLPLKP